jgi:RNA polymerase-binding transcription factor DksA
MDEDIKKRLEEDLGRVVSRLRRMGGAATAIEERPGPIGANSLGADEGDVIQANESREIGLATRELLIERVNRLSAALDRLSRGEYGACAECGEPISTARLLALPEVQTCVRCQARLERRRLEREDARLNLRAPSL